MKVLDLQCYENHLFEGWFASEEDFVTQNGSGILVCPMCGGSNIKKRLSAPRLNLMSKQSALVQSEQTPDDIALALQSAWMEMGRRIVANTDDVGDQFAQEARRIHYGDVSARGIRGQASLTETESLIDEGIAVLPLLLPDSFKQPLQ